MSGDSWSSASVCVLVVPSFPDKMQKVEGADCRLHTWNQNMVSYDLSEDTILCVYLRSELTNRWFPKSLSGIYIDLSGCKICRVGTIYPVIRFLNLYDNKGSGGDRFLMSEGHSGLSCNVPSLKEICRLCLLQDICAELNSENADMLQEILMTTLSLSPGNMLHEWKSIISAAAERSNISILHSVSYREVRMHYGKIDAEGHRLRTS